MKASELRTKTLVELSEELTKEQRKLFGMKMASQDPSSSEENRVKKHEFRAVRRDIARLKTVINQLKGNK